MNKKLNNILELICRENKEFANALDRLEKSIPSKIMDKVLECKAYEFENNMYMVSLNVNRLFNLFIQVKYTDKDYLLMLDPINMMTLESAKKRSIAVMACKSKGKDVVYNAALSISGNILRLEVGKEIEDTETHIITKYKPVTTIVNANNILGVDND